VVRVSTGAILPLDTVLYPAGRVVSLVKTIGHLLSTDSLFTLDCIEVVKEHSLDN
jgi:hypothetical protein